MDKPWADKQGGAGRLSISVHTVSRHRQNILEKLRVGNATEACRVARGLGLLE